MQKYHNSGYYSTIRKNLAKSDQRERPIFDILGRLDEQASSRFLLHPGYLVILIDLVYC